MARPSPHPLALFSLVPLNKRAEAVLEHPSNRHRVSRLIGNVGLGLDIGHIRSRCGDQATLATLGRDGDVILEGASISKVQCSFEMDLDSTVVMFYDKSRGQTCQVYGEGAFPFAHDRPRRVVVGPKINTIIGIGGLARDLLRFELQWHCEEDEVAASVKKIRETPYLDDDPRFARTIDEADTVPSSRMPTRIHTPGPQSLKVRYVEVCRLGRGQFGEVHKGLDIDSGKFIAVKKIPAPTTGFHEEWTKLKREIEILSSLSHDHIVNFISFQGLGGPEVEIIMGLKDGSLASLMRGTHSDVQNIVDTVLHHILQALDCLAAQGIIHRDVKPENILYVSRQGRFHYLLGDFGLSNRQISSTSQCGSALYAAPEVHETGEQTPKADVWSLFITILWVSNTHGFREASRTFKCFPDVRRAVLSAAPHLPSIQEMARVDPVERASAAQMLVKCYEGRGLISPRSHVPPLENVDKEASSPRAGPSKPAQNKPLPRETSGSVRSSVKQGIDRSQSHRSRPRQAQHRLSQRKDISGE